jgi:hypothetical protein
MGASYRTAGVRPIRCAEFDGDRYLEKVPPELSAPLTWPVFVL